jgi:hypothetical protein
LTKLREKAHRAKNGDLTSSVDSSSGGDEWGVKDELSFHAGHTLLVSGKKSSSNNTPSPPLSSSQYPQTSQHQTTSDPHVPPHEDYRSDPRRMSWQHPYNGRPYEGPITTDSHSRIQSSYSYDRSHSESEGYSQSQQWNGAPVDPVPRTSYPPHQPPQRSPTRPMDPPYQLPPSGPPHIPQPGYQSSSQQGIFPSSTSYHGGNHGTIHHCRGPVPRPLHHPHNAALADLGLAARDSRLDERWSNFMHDSGLLDESGFRP